jgi:hypothetical protein
MWPASVNWGHVIGGRRSALLWTLRGSVANFFDFRRVT